MARQSLKKRNQRYQLRENEEFDHYQKLLERQKVRVFRNYYSWLNQADKDRIKYHLERSIYRPSIIMPCNLGIIPGNSVTLSKAKKHYFLICKILRKGGNTKPKPPAPTKTILRRTVN